METENNKSNIIEISELNKWYGDFHALKNINMSVKEGEIIVVCGPSGSGKSTLIRCVNFLEKFQEGNIVVAGIQLTDDAQKIRKIRNKNLKKKNIHILAVIVQCRQSSTRLKKKLLLKIGKQKIIDILYLDFFPVSL